MTKRKDFSFSSIRVIKKVSWIILVIASFVQCFFWNTPANLFAVIVTLFVWQLFSIFFLRESIWQNSAYSAFAVLGFTLTQFYFPVLFTLIEAKPVIYNLDLPYDVFLHSLWQFVALLIAHLLYRKWQQKRLVSLYGIRKWLKRLSFFESPTNAQLWMMGFLGLGSMYYTFFVSGAFANTSHSIFDKVIEGVVQFTYAPYFILLPVLWETNDANKKKSKYTNRWIIGYSILVIIAGIGRNSRGSIIVGFFAVGLAYLIALLVGKLAIVTKISLGKLFLGVISVVIFLGPLSDLAVAMVLVRGERSDVKGSELVSKTFDALNDKQAIISYRELSKMLDNHEWDENYLDNEFLARFANIKYHDASLKSYSNLSDDDKSKVVDYSKNTILAISPQPILDFFGIRIDKKEINSGSFADYMYFLSSEDEESFGGMKTGHISGSGMALVGWWYILILFILIIPFYILVDSWFINDFKSDDMNSLKPMLTFGIGGILEIPKIFQFLPGESLVEIISFIIRGWLEAVLLYYLMFKITRFFSRI